MEINKEKLKNIFNKTSYVWQFIATFIFAIIIYKVVYIKVNLGKLNILHITSCILFTCITLAFMIYHIKRDGKKIEKMFLNFAILLSLLYLAIVIPSQVPDEQVHMIKAYEVSKGIFITPKKEDGTSSTLVPEDLLKYNHNTMNRYSELNKQIKLKTDYSKEVETVSSAQGYSFMFYLAPAFGLAIARTFGMNIIVGIYLAKIANLLLFITLGYFAIKKIPFGKIVLAVYLLMPMVLQQAISFSSDAFINAITIYFIAYLMSLLKREEEIRIKELIIYCILSILLAIAKIVYMPLVGIGLILIFRKNIKKKYKIIFITASIILALVFSIGEYIHSTSYTSSPESMKEYMQEFNVNSKEQISQIIRNPKYAYEVLKKDLLDNGENYIKMAVGSKLGWLEIEIPNIYILLYIILLIYSVVIEKSPYNLKILEKTWILIISLGIIVLVQLAMYISFTPVGVDFVGGVQGRYFIPILILPLLCMIRKENYIKTKYPNVTPLIISTVLNIFVLQNIYLFLG